MMVENCSTESPSTYDAMAPAASSYSSPQAATTNTLASSATSTGRGEAGSGTTRPLGLSLSKSGI